MKIISRSEAKKKGLTFYFTGKPCKHGHISKKYVSGSKCYECKTNVEKSGRQDGRKLDPAAITKRAIPMPFLDEATLADVSRVDFDTTGIDLSERGPLTKAEWNGMALITQKMAEARQWIIGDLYNNGPWGNKAAYLEQFGVPAKTAQEYGRIAKRIPKDMRNPNLSFCHHQAVCCEYITTDEQLIHWLDQAYLKKYSVRKLQTAIVAAANLISNDDNQDVDTSLQDVFKEFNLIKNELGTIKEMTPGIQEAMDQLRYEIKKANQ